MDKLAYMVRLSPPPPCRLVLEKLHAYQAANELERFCLGVGTPQEQGFNLDDETPINT